MGVGRILLMAVYMWVLLGCFAIVHLIAENWLEDDACFLGGHLHRRQLTQLVQCSRLITLDN